jgi:hypothetical protein
MAWYFVKHRANSTFFLSFYVPFQLPNLGSDAVLWAILASSSDYRHSASTMLPQHGSFDQSGTQPSEHDAVLST